MSKLSTFLTALTNCVFSSEAPTWGNLLGTGLGQTISPLPPK